MLICDKIFIALKVADVAQEAEHFIGNEEVGGSTPLVSSIKNNRINCGYFFYIIGLADLMLCINLSVIIESLVCFVCHINIAFCRNLKR